MTVVNQTMDFSYELQALIVHNDPMAMEWDERLKSNIAFTLHLV